jgi:formamidopyrimidine-DNA glycosylase
MALSAHLGMSGQLVLPLPTGPDERHLRVRMTLDIGRQLRFVDQRMFGGLHLSALVPSPDGGPGGASGPGGGESAALLPAEVAHIARDPLDPHLDVEAWVDRMQRRRSGVKRALLNQTLLSGVGNIYADEALWRAQLHYDHPAASLSPDQLRALLGHERDVMIEALAQGGTSFDSLYVNVNGESGYFARSLAVYGRTGQPCLRCSTPIVREPFMNRSSFRCPRCQLPAA